MLNGVKNFFPIAILLFLLGGVYWGYANVWLCVAAFVFALTRLNREEFVFVMLLAGAEYFGAVARIYVGFTIIPQFVIYLMVMAIIFRQIIPLFHQNSRLNYLFFFLLFVFVLGYLYGPQHGYSNIKIVKILLYGTLCFWTFLIYNGGRNIDSKKLAYIFAIVGITYIVIGVTVYHFGNPSSILDFGYFGRRTFAKSAEDFAISYHSVGLAALYGVVFLLSPKEDKRVLKSQSIALLLILIFIALVSQMRQGILGIFVLLFFRYVLLIKNKLGYKLLGMLFLIIIGIFIIKDVQTDAFQSLKEATTFEELVNRPYAKALMIIDEYPLLGKGLGGYSDNGSIAYPHNIFLEIISEVGFVGLLMILIISLQAMSYNKFSWRALNANGTYAILLLLAIFIRVNASGDLCENIYFFALLFSMRDRRGLAKRTVK